MCQIRSEAINELATSLAKAQRDFKPVVKSHEAVVKSDKGNYTYRYADLGAVLESVREPLSTWGLSVIQTIEETARGPILRTTLLHESGQWIASDFPLVCNFERPQVVGGYLTYARRYAVSALLAVATEDDDDAANYTPKARKDRPDRRPVATDRPSIPPSLPASEPIPSRLVGVASKPAPRTGDELQEFCRECKTDPFLSKWIDEAFPRYPHRKDTWTDAQVADAWPMIREHLIEVRDARRRVSVNGQSNGESGGVN